MVDREDNKYISQESEQVLFEQQLHIVQEALALSYIELSKIKSVKADLEKKYEYLLQENTLLFNQLCVFQDKLARETHLNKIAESNIDNKNEALQIKKHLSYRLGAVLVSNSKSLIGWIKIPWLLFRETRKFRSDRNKLNRK